MSGPPGVVKILADLIDYGFYILERLKTIREIEVTRTRVRPFRNRRRKSLILSEYVCS